MITLNVNIDHIATLRQARGVVEPDPVAGLIIAELAGASGIVCHLREDRRHINDRDLRIIRQVVQTKLDMEMGANEEIIRIALDIIPDLVTIVPEKRQELTTEGGLDLVSDIERFKSLTDRMHEKNIEVSFFVEPAIVQIEAALECDADMVELHTGAYSNLKGDNAEKELNRIFNAAGFAKNSGLKVAAGHGLNYINTKPVCKPDLFNEFSIGHSIMARSIFIGLEHAVKDMINLIQINSHSK
jgi:pyridoxine 5-phosphate synthase